ncbi:DUF402 domain-containing protein [Thermosporothrix hazakensis]|nr:DUF402 domain-containing protein [Thermosporothrix hazakensis]
MKIKYPDRTDWKRVVKRCYAETELHTPVFHGTVTLFRIDEVVEPLYFVMDGERVCRADNGYYWMQHFPHGSRYVITTFFNSSREVLGWYIDICARHYRNEQGRLCYEDLYLDLDILPSGKITLLDVDELDEALYSGKITSTEYELAWREAHSLMLAIEHDRFPLLWECEYDIEKLLPLLQEPS